MTENLLKNGSFWFPEPATDISASIEGLYLFILAISVVLFVAIIAVTIVFIYKYFSTEKNKKAEKQIAHNNTLEVVWTVIPLFLVGIVFMWGYKDFLSLSIAPAQAQEIRVTGQKWFWQFNYPKDGVQTIGELVVPVNQPIKLIMSSTDVIHSFFVPNMKIKRDVIPNKYTTIWFEANREGNFQVFCTEFCGDGHSQMLADLKVLSLEDYNAWLKDGQAAASDDVPLIELGQTLYTSKACNTCHTIDGSPSVGPSWKGIYGTDRPLADGSSVAVDDNYLRESITVPAAKIAKGYQAIMPAYAGLLSDREIDALIEFIKEQQ